MDKNIAQSGNKPDDIPVNSKTVYKNGKLYVVEIGWELILYPTDDKSIRDI